MYLREEKQKGGLFRKKGNILRKRGAAFRSGGLSARRNLLRSLSPVRIDLESIFILIFDSPGISFTGSIYIYENSIAVIDDADNPYQRLLDNGLHAILEAMWQEISKGRSISAFPALRWKSGERGPNHNKTPLQRFCGLDSCHSCLTL